MAGFTSFLKKFGLDAVKAVEAVAGGPKVIIQDVENSSNDLKSIINLVKTSEAMYAVFVKSPAGTSGSAKLAAIEPDVAAIIGDIEVVAGTKISSIIKDQAAFNTGVQSLISSVVSIMNACGD
jgi:hypothetical protein